MDFVAVGKVMVVELVGHNLVEAGTVVVEDSRSLGVLVAGSLGEVACTLVLVVVAVGIVVEVVVGTLAEVAVRGRVVGHRQDKVLVVVAGCMLVGKVLLLLLLFAE
jgi:hypothetical protein